MYIKKAVQTLSLTWIRGGRCKRLLQPWRHLSYSRGESELLTVSQAWFLITWGNWWPVGSYVIVRWCANFISYKCNALKKPDRWRTAFQKASTHMLLRGHDIRATQRLEGLAEGNKQPVSVSCLQSSLHTLRHVELAPVSPLMGQVVGAQHFP